MGIYTVREDEAVDKVIAKDLEFIVNRVREALPVRAIILGGGFGRGEGSVLIDNAGIRAVNDYDVFLVISDNDQINVKALSCDMAMQLGIRSIDLITIRYSELERLPATQVYYDLKYGGTLLWGENVLDQIPQYKQGCVDHRSAETLLLNRLVCALEAFSEKFVYNGMSTEERFFLVNQTGKVVSACVEALLMGRGKYHHRYSERRNIFDAEFPNWDTLRRLNRQATAFKLMPSETANIDAIAYWNGMVTEYIKVLVIYFAPRSLQSTLGLWGRLAFDRRNPISDNPIEILELMLLLGWRASFLPRHYVLSQLRRRLEHISNRTFSCVEWEPLRAGAVQLWHQLCH